MTSATALLHYKLSNGIDDMQLAQTQAHNRSIRALQVRTNQRLTAAVRLLTDDNQKFAHSVAAGNGNEIEREMAWAALSAESKSYALCDLYGNVISGNAEISDFDELRRMVLATISKGETKGFCNCLLGKLTPFASGIVKNGDEKLAIAFVFDKSYALKQWLDETRTLTGLDLYIYQGRNCLASTVDDDTFTHPLEEQIHNAVNNLKRTWLGKTDYLGRTIYVGATPLLMADGNVGGVLVFCTDSSRAVALIYFLDRFIPIAILFFIALFVFTVTNILRKVNKPIRRIVEGVHRVADGDLQTTINLNYDSTSELIEIAENIGTMQRRIRTVLEPVSNSITQINTLAQTLAEASNTLSDAANQQAASIQEISSQMEEMTSGIEHNTNNSKVTRQKAERISQMTDELSVSSKASYEAIINISRNINDIDSLVRQTNILALNASVEAARAGEMGRGFAVVAKEVRRLADQTHSTANDIKVTATSSIEGAEQSYNNVNELTPMIHQIADLVNQITDASIEQNTGVANVNSALVELNESTQDNAANAEEIAASSDTMQTMTEELAQAISAFKI